MESSTPSRPATRAADSQAAPALAAHLGYLLRLVSNEVSGAFKRALQEQDVSVAEWVALNQIAALPGLTSTRLATAMGMTRGAISKILDKLESKKLVARSASRQDSRSQALALTDRARQALPRLTRIADGNDTHFFGALDAGERALLRGLLLKLAGAHRITRIPSE